MTDSPSDQDIDISASDSPGPIQAANAKRDAYQAGRDLYVTQTPEQQRPRNEKTLLKAVRREVTDRLEQSLHNAACPINLAKESQPNQVKRPWDFEVKVGERRREALPASTTVVDVFDRADIGGKLLILGEPGAGKTTTLLDLAETLLTRAEKSLEAAMPVLFNLSSWVDDKQSISDWLLAELKLKYGASQKRGQQWLAEQKLLPLLDGLDELAPHRQELCAQQINAWLQSNETPGELVVCSRMEEYENYDTELSLSGAICLQPFTDEQISAYLKELGQSELQTAVAQNADLREIVRVPLYASIAVLVYDKAFSEQYKAKKTTKEQLSLLFEAYVINRLHQERNQVESQRSIYRGQSPPTIWQTQRWLTRLGKQLRAEWKDEFSIEEMKPSVLLITKKQKLFYRLIIGLTSGLIGGICITPIEALIIKLSSDIILGPQEVITSGLIIGLGVGLWTAMFSRPQWRRIEPVKGINWSFPKCSARVITVKLFTALLLILLFSLIGALIRQSIDGLFFGLFAGIFIIFLFLLPMELINWITSILVRDESVEDQSHKARPNEGILRSRDTAITSTGIAIIIVLLIHIIFTVLFGEDNIWIMWPIGIFSIGFTFNETGGAACIQHFALRLALWRTGQIPWNYARFLNYATDRLLLQRIGGRYRFIHKRLQDHFAAMDL